MEVHISRVTAFKLYTHDRLAEVGKTSAAEVELILLLV